MKSRKTKIQWIIIIFSTMIGAIIGALLNTDNPTYYAAGGGIIAFWVSNFLSVLVPDTVEIPSKCANCEYCEKRGYTAPLGSVLAHRHDRVWFICKRVSSFYRSKCPYGSPVKPRYDNVIERDNQPNALPVELEIVDSVQKPDNPTVPAQISEEEQRFLDAWEGGEHYRYRFIYNAKYKHAILDVNDVRLKILINVDLSGLERLAISQLKEVTLSDFRTFPKWAFLSDKTKVDRWEVTSNIKFPVNTVFDVTHNLIKIRVFKGADLSLVQNLNWDILKQARYLENVKLPSNTIASDGWGFDDPSLHIKNLDLSAISDLSLVEVAIGLRRDCDFKLPQYIISQMDHNHFFIIENTTEADGTIQSYVRYQEMRLSYPVIIVTELAINELYQLLKIYTCQIYKVGSYNQLDIVTDLKSGSNICDLYPDINKDYEEAMNKRERILNLQEEMTIIKLYSDVTENELHSFRDLDGWINCKDAIEECELNLQIRKAEAMRNADLFSDFQSGLELINARLPGIIQIEQLLIKIKPRTKENVLQAYPDYFSDLQMAQKLKNSHLNAYKIVSKTQYFVVVHDGKIKVTLNENPQKLDYYKDYLIKDSLS